MTPGGPAPAGEAGAAGRRLVLLAGTHRVAPGLLSWPAWEALRSARRVLCRDAEHPQLAYVQAAGVAVEVLDAADDRALARELLGAVAHGDVVFLGTSDGDPGLGPELAGALAGAEDPPELEVLHGSWDLPGSRLLDLVAVMDRLRSPGGCPWDAQQTHESLIAYLLEESYETVEAIESGDLNGLREELGDLLLQVVFHARLGEEHPDEPWSIDDVAAGIVDKLVRRHPHVFGDAHAPTAEHVEANWEQIKAVEKGRSSVVDGVPLAQPALALAAKLMSRAAKAGLHVAVEPPRPAPDAELGDVLLGLVAEARRRGLDAEAELRAAARRYAERVRAAEAAGGAVAEP
jgi:XTP/dITP diphosphohydrolase